MIRLIKKFIKIILILYTIFYLYKETIFFKKLFNKFVGDALLELKKVLIQFYIRDTNQLMNDILSDILEDEKFVAGLDRLIVSVYKDEYLMTYVKNLFWEAFSIFLKDIHHGSLLHTLLINILDDKLTEKVTKNFFLQFFKKKDFQDLLENYISEILHEPYFRIQLNYVYKSNILYFFNKTHFKTTLKDFIRGFIMKDEIFEHILAFYFSNFNAKDEKSDFESNIKEINYLKNELNPYDDEKYLKCVKLDMNNSALKESFLNGDNTIIDLFNKNTWDYDYLWQNRGNNILNIIHQEELLHSLKYDLKSANAKKS